MAVLTAPGKLSPESPGPGARGPTPSRRPWYLRARALGWALGGLAGALVLVLARPEAAGQSGAQTLAAMAAAVVWWAVDVGAGAASLVYTLVLLATGNSLSLALAGWREPAFWFFGAMLFYGVAMASTGMDRRIAHAVLSVVRPSHGGLLLALAIIGFVLALLLPTLRVRMTVLASITWSVTKALGRPARKSEALLLGLGTWVAAVVPGLAVPVVGLGADLVHSSLAPEPVGGLTWVGWLALFGAPAAVLTAAGLGLVYLAVRPRRPLALPRTHFRHRQLRLGKPTRREKIALVVFLLSLAAWVTKDWHGVPEGVVAMGGVAALIGTGALPLRHLAQWPLWGTLLFFATLFALPELLDQEGVTEWLGGHLTPLVHVGTESLVVGGIVLISARSSASWAPVGPEAPPRTGRAAAPPRRPRGRVVLDVRGHEPAFVYVREAPDAPRRSGGGRPWAPRAGQTSAAWRTPRRGGGWVRLSEGRGVGGAGRSAAGSPAGPWRRL